MAPRSEKKFAKRRHLGAPVKKHQRGTRIAKTGRKQAVRQSGPRRGGR